MPGLVSEMEEGEGLVLLQSSADAVPGELEGQPAGAALKIGNHRRGARHIGNLRALGPSSVSHG